jgi:hypothetical protein
LAAAGALVLIGAVRGYFGINKDVGGDFRVGYSLPLWRARQAYRATSGGSSASLTIAALVIVLLLCVAGARGADSHGAMGTKNVTTGAARARRAPTPITQRRPTGTTAIFAEMRG